MTLSMHEYIENEKLFLPDFEFRQGVTGLAIDMRRAERLMKQLKQSAYIHRIADGHYPYLTVKETLQYYCKLSDFPVPVEELLKLFQLEGYERKKVRTLPESKRNSLALIRPLTTHHKWVVIEEPYHRVELEDRPIVEALLKRMTRQGSSLLLLSSNLEDLLPQADEIYRLDDRGIHKMEFKDEEAAASVEPAQLKVEKIQVKHQDKTLLFNPPEIDYIESVEGSVYVNVAGIAYSSSLTLQELENRLQPYGFYRCHRSYIVNLQKVREIVSWTKNSYSLKLDSEKSTIIPLSRAKLTHLKEFLGL